MEARLFLDTGSLFFLLSLFLLCSLEFFVSELALRFGANLVVEALRFTIYVLQFLETDGCLRRGN